MLMRKQHRDTSIKQVVPDVAPDSDGSHLPVLGKSKQKTQMKALGECESCLYEAMWDLGEQGCQLSQQTPGFPKGKNIKAEETDSFPGYRVLVPGISQSFLNFHSHSGHSHLFPLNEGAQLRDSFLCLRGSGKSSWNPSLEHKESFQYTSVQEATY